MKNLTTLGLLLLGGTAAQAQITITVAQYPATAATVKHFQDATVGSLPTPPLGTNQNWDYRTLVAQGAPATTTYNVPPMPLPFVGTVRSFGFTTALGPFTIAAVGHEGFEAAGFDQLGTTLAAQSFPLTFATGGASDVLNIPAQSTVVNTLKLPLPLTSTTAVRRTNRTVTNTRLTIVAYGISNALFQYVQHVSTVDSVVGWGSLRLPVAGNASGSVPQPVLLVRRTETVQDSFYLGGAPAPAMLLGALGQTQGTIHRNYSQSFFRQNAAQTLLSLDYATNAFGAPTSGAYSTEADLTLTDLVVSSSSFIAAGAYRNVTITGTGSATLAGDVTVTGTFVVQADGLLNPNGHIVGGSGAFALNRRASITVTSAAGLTSSGPSGDVQVTGSRTFSPDANYEYGGNSNQATGSGLPGRVLSLVCSPPITLTFTQPVAIRRQLSFGGVTPNFAAGGITLLSDADTTAAVNYDAGSSYPGTYTIQRYVNGDRNAAAGYRHFSSPVGGATVNSLAVASRFVPVVGVGYNASATPASFTPFPTVFGYDETRLATATNNLIAFDKGWEAPTALSAPLEDGRGYTVHMAGNTRVIFTGTIRAGNVTVPLTRGSDPAAGWNFVGNPFAAPFDMSSLTGTPNVDDAKYVFETSGPYAGSYRTFLPGGMGNPNIGNPVAPIGQGFFARVNPGASSATFSMSPLYTLVNDLTIFHRNNPNTTLATPRPLLALAGAAGRDLLTVYQQAGATPGPDSRYDAAKLANPSGFNLSAVAVTGELLAIDARPAFAAGLVIPLRVEVPAAGRYTFAVPTLEQLPTGLVAYLRDAVTGQQIALTAQATPGFTLAAGLSTRFSLAFAPAGALATAAGLSAAQVALYPNPAGKAAAVTVSVPVPAGTRAATATLCNALGQVLQTVVLPATAGQATGTLSTAALAPGVYVLRLEAGAERVSKRLVVE